MQPIFSKTWIFDCSYVIFRGAGGGSGRYALEKGFPGLRVSDAETLSLQKSAKSSVKNTELASLRQLYFWHWRRFLRAKSFQASCKRNPGNPFSRAGGYQFLRNYFCETVSVSCIFGRKISEKALWKRIVWIMVFGERDIQPWNKVRAAAENGLRMLTLQRFRSP